MSTPIELPDRPSIHEMGQHSETSRYYTVRFAYEEDCVEYADEIERQLREALARNVELLESGRVSNNSLTSRILEVINENGILRAENKRLVEKVEKWAGIS